MKEKCECNSFDGGLQEYSKLYSIFETVATSKFKDGGRCGEGEYTEILKCKKCNSYYIWDSYSGVYLRGDRVSGRRYTPAIDDEGLVKILKNLEGNVKESEIEMYSKALKILRNAKPDNNLGNIVNENKN